MRAHILYWPSLPLYIVLYGFACAITVLAFVLALLLVRIALRALSQQAHRKWEPNK